ncbi:MAG: hypothetical protein ACI83P_001664 [Janthinobacterium sp.]|jgi:hypothetical protein
MRLALIEQKVIAQRARHVGTGTASWRGLNADLLQAA